MGGMAGERSAVLPVQLLLHRSDGEDGERPRPRSCAPPNIRLLPHQCPNLPLILALTLSPVPRSTPSGHRARASPRAGPRRALQADLPTSSGVLNAPGGAAFPPGHCHPVHGGSRKGWSRWHPEQSAPRHPRRDAQRLQRPGRLGLRCLGASRIAWQQGKGPGEGWVGGTSPKPPQFHHLSLAKPGSWQAPGPRVPQVLPMPPSRAGGFGTSSGAKRHPLFAGVCE